MLCQVGERVERGDGWETHGEMDAEQLLAHLPEARLVLICRSQSGESPCARHKPNTGHSSCFWQPPGSALEFHLPLPHHVAFLCLIRSCLFSRMPGKPVQTQRLLR